MGVTKEWQDVLRLMSHCVAAATLFALCHTREKGFIDVISVSSIRLVQHVQYVDTMIEVCCFLKGGSTSVL